MLRMHVSLLPAFRGQLTTLMLTAVGAGFTCAHQSQAQCI